MRETGKGSLRDWHQLLKAMKKLIDDMSTFSYDFFWKRYIWFEDLIILCIIFMQRHLETALSCLSITLASTKETLCN